MTGKTPLLNVESGCIARMLASINTITFFAGDLDIVAPQIRSRFQEIIQANLWLTGHLTLINGSDRITLVHNERVVTEDVFATLFVLDPTTISVHVDLSYAYLIKAVSSAFVPKTTSLLKQRAPIIKLTLCKDSRAPHDRFGLILSLSHTVGDGHTYYQLLNMISAVAQVKTLQVTRKDKAEEKIVRAMGKKEHAYWNGATHIINGSIGLLFGRKTQVFAYHINADDIKDRKKQSQLNNHVDFISTNDIIVSAFSKLIGARIMSMAINFREKIASLQNDDAGNYEGVVMYDEARYKTPAKIRKTLQNGPPFWGLGEKLPNFWEGVFCKMGLITNWASFATELKFAGCRELLHLPLVKKMPYAAAIIFRVKQRDLGIILFSTKSKKQVEASALPLGQLISKKIF